MIDSRFFMSTYGTFSQISFETYAQSIADFFISMPIKATQKMHNQRKKRLYQHMVLHQIYFGTYVQSIVKTFIATSIAEIFISMQGVEAVI